MTSVTEAPITLRSESDVVEMVPYLLGFTPTESVVLVAMAGGKVLSTARVDLDVNDAVLAELVRQLQRGGADRLIAVIFTEQNASVIAVGIVLRAAAAAVGVAVAAVLPGRPAGAAVSSVAVAAVVQGMVARASREELTAVVTGVASSRQREATMRGVLGVADATACTLLERAPEAYVHEAVAFIAETARRLEADRAGTLSDADAARIAIALQDTQVRDAAWLAIDAGELAGSTLWRELFHRVPEPLDAPALFLFGWECWRAGNGVLAGEAARRATDSAAGYHAAVLLLQALGNGLSPVTTPPLSRLRSSELLSSSPTTTTEV